MKKLVRGIGIYEKGAFCTMSREYRLWSGILNRCNPSGDVQKKQPSYIGCIVHPDFIKFQDFAEWCQNQIGMGVQGFELDKDILIPGNKVYGPDTCVFVPKNINLLMTKNDVNRGNYPIGVGFFEPLQKFVARIKLNSRNVTIGYYTTIDAAFTAYKVTKLAEIHRQAQLYQSQIDPRCFAALIRYEINPF